MSDKIPDEREITKQQLWKRIEASAQGVSSTVQGFQSQIDEVLSNVKDSVEQALRKERKTNEEIRAAFISEIKKTKNELIQYSDKLNENLQESMSTAKLDVDKRLREFKAQLETSFDTRLENMLTQLNENIVTVSNKIDLYQADTRQERDKYMTEIGQKYGQLKNIVDEMISRWKKFANLK